MNLIKRALLFCSLVFAITLTASTAFAYPPGGVSVATNASSYAPGATIVLTAAGFEDCPNTLVTFTITNTVTGEVTTVTATLSELGVASMTTPASSPGSYQVTATAACGHATTSFSVAKPSDEGPLPHNGSNTSKLAVPAAALVLGGAGMLIVARRRRSEGDRVRVS